MSKKRFIVADHSTCVFDNITKEEYVCIDREEAFLVCKRLNKQQENIQKMKHSLNTIYKAFEKHYGYDMRNAVWLINELSYDEIVDELNITETDSKNLKESIMYLKKKVDEQQDTIKKQKRIIKSQDDEISRQYNLCLAMSGVLREKFGVYDVFDRTKDKKNGWDSEPNTDYITRVKEGLNDE